MSHDGHGSQTARTEAGWRSSIWKRCRRRRRRLKKLPQWDGCGAWALFVGLYFDSDEDNIIDNMKYYNWSLITWEFKWKALPIGWNDSTRRGYLKAIAWNQARLIGRTHVAWLSLFSLQATSVGSLRRHHKTKQAIDIRDYFQPCHTELQPTTTEKYFFILVYL